MNSIVDLIQKIITNNPAGVYANLVREGKMSPGLNPSVQEVISAVQHELEYGQSEKGAFLIRVFDVPIQTNGLYANDLFSLQTSTGKSPVMVLTDQLMIESTSVSSTLYGISQNPERVPWVTWVLLGLMILGAIAVFRFTVKLVGKIIQ